jgi:hypothetical protein
MMQLGLLESVQQPEVLATAIMDMSPDYSDWQQQQQQEFLPPAPYDDIVEEADLRLSGPSAPPELLVLAPQQQQHPQPQQHAPQMFSVDAITVHPAVPPALVAPSAPPPSNVFFVNATSVSHESSVRPVMATVVHANSAPQLAMMTDGNSSTRPSSSASSTTQPPPLTASNLAATRRVKSSRSNYSVSKSSSAQSLLYAVPKESGRKDTQSTSFSMKSLMDSLQGFQDNMAGKMEKIRNEKKKEKVDEHQARELFPRMP